MRRFIPLKALILLVVFVVIGGLTARSASAAAGQIYVSPPTASVQNQANFTVAVRINPGTGVNYAQFTLSWDSSKLRYVSLDTSQSAFGSSLVQSASASSVTIGRGVALPAPPASAVPISSDSLIATVTLQALAGSGSAALTLSNTDAYDPNGVSTGPTNGNGSVTLTTPATPPPSTGGGTSSGSSSGSSSGGTKPTTTKPGTTTTTPTPTQSTTDTTPPKVEASDVAKDKLQFNSALVSLSTDEPTQVYIKYGLNGLLSQQTTLSELSKTHSIDLAGAGLVPGSTYSYQVIVKDANGNETQAPVKTFKTKGYTLKVTVLGKDNKPLKKATVQLHSDPLTAKTDGNGVAQFNDVAPGSHHVTYTSGGKDYSQAIAVDDNVVTNAATGAQTAVLQSVAVQFAVTGSGSFPALLPVTLLGLVAVAITLFVFRGKFMPTRSWQRVAAATNQPSVSMPAEQNNSFTGPSDATHTGSASIDHVHGLSTPDPGSIVKPHDDGEKGE